MRTGPGAPLSRWPSRCPDLDGGRIIGDRDAGELNTPRSSVRRLAHTSWGEDARSSPAMLRRSRAGQLGDDAEASGGAGGEGEGSVMGLGDALGDREAEADAGVIRTGAVGA